MNDREQIRMQIERLLNRYCQACEVPALASYVYRLREILDDIEKAKGETL